MAPLLHGTTAADLDIITIQEPWQNPFHYSSYNPPQSGFHLAFTPLERTRVCFYINKALNPDSWEIDDEGNPDIATLHLRTTCGGLPTSVHIHNVYNPSPQHRTALEVLVIDELVAQLQAAPEASHIVVGDFNLHHPTWGGLRCLMQHVAADRLLDVAAAVDLNLTLPPGTITWRAHHLESTIDLTLVSATLTPRVVSCHVVDRWEQSSDHRPILTYLDLQTTEATLKPQWTWARTDVTKLQATFRNRVVTQVWPSLGTTQGLDTTAELLTLAIQTAIETATPWAQPSPQARPG